MATIETLHHKFITKLSILENIGNYIQEVVIIYIDSNLSNETLIKPKLKTMSYTKYMDLLVGGHVLNRDDIDKILVEIALIKSIYNTGASPLLSLYYADDDLTTSVHIEYNTFIMSENILDRMDHIIIEIRHMVKTLQKDKEFRSFLIRAPELKKSNELEDLSLRLMAMSENVDVVKSYKDFFTVFQKQTDEYDQYKITLVVKRDMNNDCSCGGKMTILPDTSELRCDDCGIVITLEGTVFEDSQFYTQQGQCTKHKKYDAKRHCKKWLDQIQAKENKAFPMELTNSLSARARVYYTRNGRLRTMSRMKCSQIRDWLKEEGETDNNPHAPLLRKIITSENGKAVIPPQLKYEEEQRILVLFSRAMDVYDLLMEEKLTNITNNRRPNKPYYPYVLFKILHMVIKKGNRLDGLIECIHLQSDGTLKNHDTIWKKICEHMSDERDFVYKPTDRTILLDVF